MSVFFLSDLHIVGSDDPFFKKVMSFLEQNVKGDDTVAFGGDIFDVFVGNKAAFTRRYQEFFLLLKKLAQSNVQIHYVEGNHDFQLASAFAGIPHCQIHPDEARFSAEGKTFFVAHGDHVDPNDWTYRILRRFFRSKVMSLLITLLPGDLLYWVGRHWSRYSRDMQSAFPEDFSAQKLEMVRDTFRHFAETTIKSGVNYVVLGHSHDPDQQTYSGPNGDGEYWNMGFPKATGTVLKWQSGSGFSRVRL